jgi:hypothetical protein
MLTDALYDAKDKSYALKGAEVLHTFAYGGGKPNTVLSITVGLGDKGTFVGNVTLPLGGRIGEQNVPKLVWDSRKGDTELKITQASEFYAICASLSPRNVSVSFAPAPGKNRAVVILTVRGNKIKGALGVADTVNLCRDLAIGVGTNAQPGIDSLCRQTVDQWNIEDGEETPRKARRTS